jgi:hypothetical protein
MRHVIRDVHGVRENRVEIVNRSKRWYVVWWAAMPTVVFVAAFTVLCLKECTATPWLCSTQRFW